MQTGGNNALIFHENRQYSPGLRRQSLRNQKDLPAQGATVKLVLRVARWQSFAFNCVQGTFDDRLPQIVAPYGRTARRIGNLALVLAHAARGRPA